jgi:hypothetical protein
MKQPARWQNHRGSKEKCCSYSVQYVRLRPILMSILLYHYKQLIECISEVEQIDAKSQQQEESINQEEEGGRAIAPKNSTATPRQLKLSEF